MSRTAPHGPRATERIHLRIAAADALADTVGQQLLAFFTNAIAQDLERMDTFVADAVADPNLQGSQEGARAGRERSIERMHETFSEAHEALEFFESEFDELHMLEPALDLYESVVVEGDGVEAFIDGVRTLIGLLYDLIGTVIDILGDAVVGAESLLEADSERSAGVESVIEGEVP